MQVILMHKQYLHSLRLKRLELANGLDTVCNNFLLEKCEARKVSNWLMSNLSNFIFLLNNKDMEKYNALCKFLFDFQNTNVDNIENKIQVLEEFNNLLYELDLVLGNANYGYNTKNNSNYIKKR